MLFDNTFDNTNAFGYYRPHIIVKMIISLAQKSPRNWFGQQIAQVCRKLVLRFSRLPIDISVGKIKMRCYLKNNNSEKRFVFMPWRFEGVERKLLMQVLPVDGTFVDIGANVGIWSLDVATHLNPLGRIIALEPNPTAFERLSCNFRATCAVHAEWPRVDLLQIGVNSLEGETDLHLDPENLGGSSLYKRKATAQEGRAIPIMCKPLLLILNELSVSTIEALKIDIEGAEDLALVPFLEAAPSMLLPQYIFMENSQRLWRLDLVGKLCNRGYKFHSHTKGNLIYQLAETRASTINAK